MNTSAETTADTAMTHQDIRKNAMHSTLWIAVGFGFEQLLKIVSSVLLTRLIHPEVYGLMDLVLVFSVAMALFSDIGITPCVIQNKRGTELSFLNTAWTLQALRGVLLFFAACAIAWPVSRTYGRPILLPLIVVMGAGTIIDSLVSTGIFTLSRRVQRGRIVVFELSRSLSTFVVTLAIVYLLDPVGVHRVFGGELETLPYSERLTWAVIGGWLGGRLVYAALSYLAIAHPYPRFTWEPSAVREIFGFGKWVFMSTGLTFLAMYTDRMIVPKVVGFEAGGLYGRALGLAGIPVGLMASFASNVVFPLSSRLHEDGKSIRQTSGRIYLTGSIVGGVLMSALIACGPAASRILYPNTYADVGKILQLAGIASWVGVQAYLAQNMLMGFNHRTAMVVPTVGKIIGIVAFVWPAVWFAKSRGYTALTGLIFGFGAAEFARYCVMVYYASRARMVTWQTDILIGPAMLAIAAAGLSIGGYCNSQLLGFAAPVARLEWFRLMVLQGVVVAALWGAISGVLIKLGYLRLR